MHHLKIQTSAEVVHVALFLVSESLRRCRRPVPRSATLGRGVLQRRLRIPTLDFQTESLCHSFPQSLPRSVSVGRVCLAERRITARYACAGSRASPYLGGCAIFARGFPRNDQSAVINILLHLLSWCCGLSALPPRADKPATPLRKV